METWKGSIPRRKVSLKREGKLHLPSLEVTKKDAAEEFW